MHMGGGLLNCECKKNRLLSMNRNVKKKKEEGVARTINYEVQQISTFGLAMSLTTIDKRGIYAECAYLLAASTKVAT